MEYQTLLIIFIKILLINIVLNIHLFNIIFINSEKINYWITTYLLNTDEKRKKKRLMRK